MNKTPWKYILIGLVVLVLMPYWVELFPTKKDEATPQQSKVGTALETSPSINLEKTTTTSKATEETEKEVDLPTREKTIVTKIIDGDTIEITGGRRVRYIGMDTPEISGSIDCYGPEATTKNKELVENKEVEMEKDVSETDKYGRLLRYVYINGQMINETLVKEGYAKVSTYPPDVKYKDIFVTAEQEARNNNKGLWGSACACAQETVSAQGTSCNTVSIKTSSYSCNCSKTCAQMSSCKEAYYQLNTCGCSKRDGDDDGVPCESICK